MRTNLRRSILDRILRGVFRPGDPIRESRLAAELGASRTPLREALFSLEGEGFVRSNLGRGFWVEGLTSRDVREMYPILCSLECLALRTAFPFVRDTIPQLTRINRRLARTKLARSALLLDRQWHETLLRSCQNKRLLGMIDGLRLAIRRYEHFYMSDFKLIPSSVAQHRRIITALRNNNAESAIQALQENWNLGMRALLLKLGEH
jgi:DNA-binding GntR family transcriptional regulator